MTFFGVSNFLYSSCACVQPWLVENKKVYFHAMMVATVYGKSSSFGYHCNPSVKRPWLKMGSEEEDWRKWQKMVMFSTNSREGERYLQKVEITLVVNCALYIFIFFILNQFVVDFYGYTLYMNKLNMHYVLLFQKEHSAYIECL